MVEQATHGHRLHSIGVTWSDDANTEASLLLKSLTDGRHETLAAATHAPRYLPGSAVAAELAKEAAAFDERMVAMQRTVAKPRPYHFVIRPAAKDAKK